MVSKNGIEPEQPPQINKTFSFYGYQKIGVGILILIMLLSIFNVFGDSRREKQVVGQIINFEVHYPAKFRYKTIDPLEIYITNTSQTVLATTTVRISEDYISKFSGVDIIPSAKVITDNGYEIILNDIRPGETQKISINLQAEKYWKHSGWIEVDNGQEVLAEELSTIIFP